ncbi:MAG: glycosyltransferase family 4 protein [Candidatus Didemnitutus sp.]|nr:glycosyltransferase family 4 protein [Candidatus Didemnitutus sp.]
MKTLLICPDLFNAEGGIARIMRQYLRALCDLAGPGDTVECVAMMDSGDTSARVATLLGGRKARVENCERSRFGFLFVVLIRAFTCQRIVCGHLHQLLIARMAKIFNPRLDYILIAHGIEVWRPYTLLERAALRGAKRILCVSEHTRRQMLRFDPSLAPEKLLVLPNTFDPGFKPAPHARATGAADTDARPRLLVVSRLSTIDPYKGVDLMIEAMPAILRQFPRAQLRIVGGGDARPRLEALAHGRVAAEAVAFLGPIDDAALRAEYEACDLFALPSRKEGFGLVYLEAMSYGKPCLAARAGGAPEVVDDDVGAVVEYGNTEQIALAVADLVYHPRSADAIAARVTYFAYPQFVQRLTRALT